MKRGQKSFAFYVKRGQNVYFVPEKREIWIKLGERGKRWEDAAGEKGSNTAKTVFDIKKFQ